MCNLYSLTRGQEAMRRAFRVKCVRQAISQALPLFFPRTMAPVARTAPEGERDLTLMRWGFPPPPNLGKVPVTVCAQSEVTLLARTV
jgi:putative SOS response-associated peptidase YedK